MGNEAKIMIDIFKINLKLISCVKVNILEKARMSKAAVILKILKIFRMIKIVKEIKMMRNHKKIK